MKNIALKHYTLRPKLELLNCSIKNVNLFFRKPLVLQSRLTPHVVALFSLTHKGNFSIVSSEKAPSYHFSCSVKSLIFKQYEFLSVSNPKGGNEMRWPNNFFLRITMWGIKLVVFLLLFVPVVAAQNKVVVIPFFDSSSNDQFITMRDYGAPGNCVHTYRGNYGGEFIDPLLEITTTYSVSSRWKQFDSEGSVFWDFLDYDNGFLDNLSGNYTVFDQTVYGFLPPGQKKVGDSWAD